jgi:hypothetical protein
MQHMSDSALVSDLEAMSKDAAKYNGEFMAENAELLDRYLSNPYGDEQPELSSVISNDVEDTVESYMVSMARVFLGPGDIIKFKPRDPDSKEDVKEADQKSLYADWLIRGQDDSYLTQFSALKDILVQKFGVVKYFIEDKKEAITETYTATTAEELAAVMATLEDEEVESVEIIDKSGDFTVNADPIDFSFKVMRNTQAIKIAGVPTECFVITRNAKSKDDADIVGDDSVMTRGDLVAMGFGKAEVNKIPLAGAQNDGPGRIEDIRDADQGGEDIEYAPSWASEEVLIKNRYPRIDYDGDGIAERRYVMYGGDVVLINEPFDHVPYAIGSAIIMPHRAIGRSIAEQAAPFARQNTSLMRGMFDNAYAVNMPRIAYNEDVDEDDLFDMEHGGGIRVNGRNNPGQSMFPIQIPYVGDKTLMLLQYQAGRKAQTTGTIMASQGLRSDDFNDETATRFEGVRSEGKGKTELVARNIAEVFYRQLYEGVIWLAKHFQNSEQEIRATGEPLRFDPSSWKYDHSADVKVGLGAGDEDHIVETMSAVLNLTLQLQQTGSPLVDEKTKFNTIETMLKGLGISDVARHFNNPDQPDKLIRAENEQMKLALQQMQIQLDQLQQKNPLAEAEMVKAQSQAQITQLKEELSMAKEQGKQSLAAAKLKEDRRQFDIKTAQAAGQFQQSQSQDSDQFEQDKIIELTKLELESGKDVPGGVV